MNQGKSALNTFCKPMSCKCTNPRSVCFSSHGAALHALYCPALRGTLRPETGALLRILPRSQHSSRVSLFIFASQRVQGTCSVFLLFHATHCGPVVFFPLLHVVRTCTPGLQSHPIAEPLVRLRPTRACFSVSLSPTGARCPFLSHILAQQHIVWLRLIG
jgi:hypothetical protein